MAVEVNGVTRVFNGQGASAYECYLSIQRQVDAANSGGGSGAGPGGAADDNTMSAPAGQ